MNKYRKIGSLMGLTLLGAGAVTVPFVLTNCSTNKPEPEPEPDGPTSFDLAELKPGSNLTGAKLTFDINFDFTPIVSPSVVYITDDSSCDITGSINAPCFRIIKGASTCIQLYDTGLTKGIDIYNSAFHPSWFYDNYIIGSDTYDIINNANFYEWNYSTSVFDKIFSLPETWETLCQVTLSS